MAMRCIWLQNQQMTFRDDQPLPKPLANEALVKVLLAGLCATDLEMLKGYYPFTGVPGHEFVGQIVEAFERPDLAGRRVVGGINIGCGACDICRAGDERHCRGRQVLGLKGRNGTFAEYLSIPLANLHLVPDSLCNESAVFTELIAAAGQIFEKIRIGARHSVLIAGAGRLGQLTARIVRQSGCRLQVVARYENQRKLLDQEHIAWIPENKVKPDTFDIAIDTTGVPKGFDMCCRAVRPRGTVVLKSTYPDKYAVSLSQLVVDEVTLVGSRCGSMQTALERLIQGQIDPRPLIRKVLKLEQISEAIEMAQEPGSMQILIAP